MLTSLIDIRVFLSAMLVTAVFVKLAAYLPERYYFSFSRIVDAKNDTQFLARPELPTLSTYCNAIQNDLIPEADVSPRARNACSVIAESNVAIPIDAKVGSEFVYADEYRELARRVAAKLQTKIPLIRQRVEEAGYTYDNYLESVEANQIADDLHNSGFDISALVLNSISGETGGPYDTISTEILADDQIASMISEASTFYETDEDLGDLVAREDMYKQAALSDEYRIVARELRSKDSYMFFPALLIKLLPAFLTGALVALVIPSRALFDAPLGAAAVAFLFCWPVMVLWDAVVDASWLEYRATFFGLYLVYIVSYFFSARLGAMLAMRLPTLTLPDGIKSQIEWNKVLATAITTLVTSAITAGITMSFAFAK